MVKVTAIMEVCSKLVISVYNIQHFVLLLPLGTGHYANKAVQCGIVPANSSKGFLNNSLYFLT